MSAPSFYSLDNNVGVINQFILSDNGTAQNFGQRIKSFFDPTAGLPTNPADGDSYISLATNNGWVVNNIEFYSNLLKTWKNIEPINGNMVWVDDLNAHRFWNSDLLLWVDFPTISGTIPIAPPTVDNTLVRWNGIGGDSVQSSSVTLSDTGDLSNIVSQDFTPTGSNPGGGNTIWFDSTTINRPTVGTDPILLGPTASTDNAVVRYDGVNGKVQDSLVTVGDTGDVYIPGKLTVDGLIDPTGLELVPQAANPGNVTANTLWLDSNIDNRVTVGADPLLRGGAGVYTDNGIVRYDGTTGLTQNTEVVISDLNSIIGLEDVNMIGIIAAPTGVSLNPQATNPGNANTLWLNSNIDNRVTVGVDPLLRGGAGVYTDNGIVRYDGTTGLTQNTEVVISDLNSIIGLEDINMFGIIAAPTGVSLNPQATNPGNANTLWLNSTAGNRITAGTEPLLRGGSGAFTDNGIVRYDGTTGLTQNSEITISDLNSINNVADIDMSGIITSPIGINFITQPTNPIGVNTLWANTSGDINYGSIILTSFKEFTFTSSGTHLIPTNATNIILTAWGGGGGGGGGQGNGGNGGGGGGSGANLVGLELHNNLAGQIINFSIGAGGAGGLSAPSGADGGTGGIGGATTVLISGYSPISVEGGIGGAGGSIIVGIGGAGGVPLSFGSNNGGGSPGGAGGTPSNPGSTGGFFQNNFRPGFGGDSTNVGGGGGGGGGGYAGIGGTGGNTSNGGNILAPNLGAGGGGGGGGAPGGGSGGGRNGSSGGVIIKYHLT